MRTLFTLSGVLLVSAGFAACGDEGSSGGDAQNARVTRVIDGDTVEMERLGKVRLIGVNAPEKERCYDDAATRFTRNRLEGEVVQYEIGEEPKDRYDRTLAYLTRMESMYQMHNLELLSNGYAKVLTIPPNDKYEERFERAERKAKGADEGLWYTCDRDAIRARRAAIQRRKELAEERRVAAAARREARRTRRAARARRARAALRRAERQAEEEVSSYGDDSGGGSSDGGSGGFACGPGDIDGDGDGRCNE